LNAVHRRRSLEALRNAGPAAEAAVHRIQVALYKGLVGADALGVLKSIGTERAIAGIADAISHQDPKVKEAAISLLGDLQEAAQPVVENLIRAMQDKSAAPAVVRALAKIGGPRALSGIILARARGAVPALVRASEDSDAIVSQAAQRALDRIRADDANS
jgi:HEAT repeat protein